MDKISIVGLAIGVVAIVGAHMVKGGHASSLLHLTALMIVVGGTAGAVMLQSSTETFARGMRLARWVFVPPGQDGTAIIQRIVGWSQTARRGGLLALEPSIEFTRAPFERKGLQLLVDGADPAAMRESLEIEIGTFEAQHRAAARVWEAAGGYSPTIGILGAVLGLIHVMENLTDPDRLGAGIAVAFVATIYGVGFANLVFLPIASKLKALIAHEVALREMVVEGLVAIANGENPRAIETRLRGFLVAG